MAYTKKNIKNLTGGVSQQPDSERFDNQCSEQKNFISDPVRGLTKRAGTQMGYQATNPQSLLRESKNTFIHPIRRSSTQELLLSISHTNNPASSSASPRIELWDVNAPNNNREKLKVVGSDGVTEITGNHSYLELSEATDTHPYSAVTIADYTFLVNNQKVPALKTTKSGGVGMYEREHVKRGIIFIREGAYSAKYNVKATDSEGVTRSITISTSDGTTSGGTPGKKDIDTENIAAAIHGCLETKLGDSNGNKAFGKDKTISKQVTGSGTANQVIYHPWEYHTELVQADNRILAKWQDDSEQGAAHLFNGSGTARTVGVNKDVHTIGGSLSTTQVEQFHSGSDYHHGALSFSSGSQPAAGDYVRIQKPSTSSEFYEVEFFANGGTYSGSKTPCELGTTLTETAENFVAALNGISSVLVTASLSVHEDAHFVNQANSKPYVKIHANSSGDVYSGSSSVGTIEAKTSGGIAVGWATYLQMRGGTGSAGTSTAGVRYPIVFERLKMIDNSSVETYKGSIITWYASYPTKAAMEASPINIEVTDSYGDTMVETFTESTDTFSALPSVCPNNFLMKIEGDTETDLDDHYLKFALDNRDAEDNEFGGGKWEESLQSGLQYQIDPATMPHQLIKVTDNSVDAQGVYKLVEAEWSSKVVGDAESDATPSFIGNNIRDIFFFKGRLGLLAGENAILSEVDNAYNFWRTTVGQNMDSDRIDVSSSANEITFLNWAVPFANQLVIFSERGQFLLTQGNQGLTPSTAALSLGSSYENSTICRPVVNDNSIVFAQEKSGASAVYEMYPTGSTEISFEAKSISEHVPTYISGNITNIAASSLANTIVVQTDVGDNVLYVYKYFNQGNNRVQAAWSKYEITCQKLKAGKFMSDKFHLFEGHNNGSTWDFSNGYWVQSYLKFDNTDSRTNSVDLAHNVSTDDMGYESTYSGKTTITVKDNFSIGNYHPSEGGRRRQIVVFDSTNNTTYEVDLTNSTGHFVHVTGNIASNSNIILGLKFEASYEFSKQYIKRAGADGKQMAITDGRTTTKWYEVYFNDTQYIKSTVSFPSYANRTSSVKEYTGSFSGGAVTGDQPSETSTLRTSVAARSDLPTITLSSDTHQTVTITGAAFELMYTSRLSRTN